MNGKTIEITVLRKKNKKNKVIYETSDSKSSPENIETKSSPENIETRNPSNDCKINEKTDCLTITDEKSSIQENKRTKDRRKRKEKQANDNAYIVNGNKIKKKGLYTLRQHGQKA